MSNKLKACSTNNRTIALNMLKIIFYGIIRNKIYYFIALATVIPIEYTLIHKTNYNNKINSS